MSRKINFIGRKEPLKYLNQLLNRKSASLAVIRGRRRIGKSRLVEEFGVSKGFLKFSGLAPEEGTTAQDQRDYFADCLTSQLGLLRPDSSNWMTLFLALAQALKNTHQVVLFDEISWMAYDDPTFMPKFKQLWDDELSKRAQFVLVLCGSVSSWIDKNVLSSTALFGRICERITLTELSLPESLALIDEVGFQGSLHEKFVLLSITGGIPWYIELFGGQKNLMAAINHLCFRSDGTLVEEYNRIFNDLFGKRSNVYTGIIELLASGPKENKAIADGINYSRSGLLSEYLDDLVTSGFLVRDSVWSFNTGLDRKIKPYRLKDNYLRFYLKVIKPNLPQIERGHFQEQSYTNMKVFHTMTGLQFENLMLNNRDFIYEQLDIKRIDIVADNPYLQRATKQYAGCQIDLLIQTKLNHLYVIEIKFSSKPIGIGVIDEVQQKIKTLKVPMGFSVSPILLYFGELTDGLEESEYFRQMIDATSLFSS